MARCRNRRLGDPWDSLEKRFRDQGLELISEAFCKDGIMDQDTGLNVPLLSGFSKICGSYERALIVHDDALRVKRRLRTSSQDQ